MVTTRAPTEEVSVNILAGAVLACRCAKIVPLVVSKLPIRSVGTTYVLQVALREIHLVAATVYGEFAVYRAFGGLGLCFKIGSISCISSNRNGAWVVGISVLPMAEGEAAIGIGCEVYSCS